ncbi:MAG: hypothetical protein WC342_10355 [Methanoregula sp.]
MRWFQPTTTGAYPPDGITCGCIMVRAGMYTLCPTKAGIRSRHVAKKVRGYA